MNFDLERETRWLADHWDETPARLHSRGVDDGSQWGAPPYSSSFQSWIGSQPFDKVTVAATVTCAHPRAGSPCPDCHGDNVKVVASTRYRYPMRAAIEAVRRSGNHKAAETVYRYRLNDWNLETTTAGLGLTVTEGTTALLRAIRLVKSKFAQGPVTRPRRISDAQADAEAVRSEPPRWEAVAA